VALAAAQARFHMVPGWLWRAIDWLGLTKTAALGAVVSIVAAAASLLGSFLSTRWLQKANARHLSELEARKADLQRGLEERKAVLQDGLEERKATLQSGLEGRKTELQKDLEERKTDLQASLESRKLLLQKDLEQFKAEIADDLAAQSARRAYEYEARKRLYAQVEPLLFQLFEASEGAFHAVTSLSRTQRRGDIPGWLGGDGYYMRSIVHRLFLPLSILRLMQRSTTLLDLRLDPSIRLRYALLKECYLTLTDDFGVATLGPGLEYDPNARDWRSLRAQRPDVYWRQGLVIGRLDRLVDAMVISENASRRPMNFGEFETAIREPPRFADVYESAQDIFTGFDFRGRPVLGRMLTVYACLFHVLMSIYDRAPHEVNLLDIAAEFNSGVQSAPLRWWRAGEPDVLEIVQPYVQQRIKQATTQGSYVRF
jgi:hypothetical protein